MSFFKKFFKKKNKKSEHTIPERPAGFSGISTEEHFNNRFTEEPLDAIMVDGALKMVQSFFMDTKSQAKVESPINHPINLDQTIDESFGFKLYCSAFDMGEQHALMFLAMSFNEFLISKHGFKLYRDSEPEFPLRSMTLKYNNEGAIISLYPIEYTSQVLNHQATFEDLYNKVKSNLESMPTAEDIYNRLMNDPEN